MAKINQKLQGKYKATSKTLDIILNAIGEGLTQRDASILAGISEDTLSLWKREDSEFSEQLRQKEVEYKLSHIKNIKKASEKSWQASAWWLERKYKDEFSMKAVLETKYNNEAVEKLRNELRGYLNSLKDKVK